MLGDVGTCLGGYFERRLIVSGHLLEKELSKAVSKPIKKLVLVFLWFLYLGAVLGGRTPPSLSQDGPFPLS